MTDENTSENAGETQADSEATEQSDNPTDADRDADTSTDEGQKPTEEKFDQERAMATIRKLRIESKAGSKALKELDQLKQERQKIEDAKLSEQELLTKKAADLEQQLSQERLIARDRSNQYEVQLHAAKLGIVDPDAAVKLLDWDELEYDGDGKPKDVVGALKELIVQRPYLAGQQAPPAATQGSNPVSTTNPATRPQTPGSRVYRPAELADYPFYLKNREDIELAYKEGRVRDN